MIGQRTHEAIAQARATLTAMDRAIHSLPPELRNEVKAAAERYGSVILTATALRQLVDELPTPADFPAVPAPETTDE